MTRWRRNRRGRVQPLDVDWIPQPLGDLPASFAGAVVTLDQISCYHPHPHLPNDLRKGQTPAFSWPGSDLYEPPPRFPLLARYSASVPLKIGVRRPRFLEEAPATGTERIYK
jgi:hypothetical protein